MALEVPVGQIDGVSLGMGVLGGAAAVGGVLLAGAALYRRYDRGTYSLEVAVSKLLAVLICRLWYGLRRVGDGTIPPDGPVIVAANHTCSIDPVLLTALCPRRYIGFLIAREYSNIPIIRYWVKMVECIPVNRDGLDAPAARAAMRHLRAGKVLGIFPEGRILPPGEAADPKEGVAMLALRTGARVIPAYISGTRYADSIYASIFLPHRARVAFGPPVDLSRYLPTRRERETVAAAAEAIMQAIRALAPAGEGPGSDSDPPPP